ncbi:MAG: MBL fold metallo-hydrolase [Kiritimatiellia bacterium]
MSIDRFRTAVSILFRHPPAWKFDKNRDRAFSEIDRFLEEYVRPGQPCDLKKRPNEVWDTVETYLVKAVTEIEKSITLSAKPQGVTVWQMYNSGVIIQFAGKIVALDLLPIIRDFDWVEPPGFTRRIANMVDMLLVTHRHKDHCDAALVRACLRSGKPVMMPKVLADTFGEDPLLIPVDGILETELAGLKITARTGCHVWKETIAELPVAYYEVTAPDGFSFIFAGDTDYTKEFEKTPGKDIHLLFIPWRNPNAFYEEGQPNRKGTAVDAVNIALKKIKPRALVYEHYGELKHVYEGFAPSYGMAAWLKKEIKTPSERMFWGEKITMAGVQKKISAR